MRNRDEGDAGEEGDGDGGGDGDGDREGGDGGVRRWSAWASLTR